MSSPPLPCSRSSPEFSTNRSRVPKLDQSPRSIAAEKLATWSSSNKRTNNVVLEHHHHHHHPDHNHSSTTSSSSPYYKGLTDFSLDIKKDKLTSLLSIYEATSLRNSKSTFSWSNNQPNLNEECIEEEEEVIYTRHEYLHYKRFSAASSPYYKGLTDFSLDIQKAKVASTDVHDAAPATSKIDNDDVLPSDKPVTDTDIHDAVPKSSKIDNVLPADKPSKSRNLASGAMWPSEKTDDNVSLPRKNNLEFNSKTGEKTPEIDELVASVDDNAILSSSDKFSSSINSVKGKVLSKIVNRLSATKKNSELTAESLEEFNKRNAVLDERRTSNASPYYKGLTDFSLDIHKEKVPVIEIHETASVTSSTRESFVVKIQQMGEFCFFFRKKYEKDGSSSSSSSPKTRKDTTEYSKKGVDEVKTSSLLKNNTALLSNHEGKPLRERGLSAGHVPQPQKTTKSQPLTPPQLFQPTETKKIVLEEELNEIEEEKRKSFTWGDDYRPYTLNDFICNRATAIDLVAAAKSEDCRHFIFEGRPGVGKRTMIWALLREAFGAEKVQSREECKEFGLKGEAVSSIQVKVKKSSQHVEVNLSELKGYEKHVIVELIKEKSNRLSSNLGPCTRANCQAIILYEADKLSTDALLYIKWLLERYRGCNKVFFCCNEVSKLEPFKSLCTVVKLDPPSDKEIVQVLKFVAKKEGIQIPDQLAKKMADNSKNNLRQAIRSFEATWRYNNCNSELKEEQKILTGWEEDIAKVAVDIIKEQSPRQLYNIRRKLQRLIEHNVSPNFIFKTLVEELKKNCSESLQTQVDNLYKEFNKDQGGDNHLGFSRNRMEETNEKHNDPVRKKIQHFMKIEEFIAKFMSWYKSSGATEKIGITC